jgi:hypothetical protein
MSKRIISLLAGLTLAAASFGCDDLMSDFDEPHAAAFEPVRLEGRVEATYADDGVFLFEPADSGDIVGTTILVFPPQGVEIPPEEARVRVAGKVRGTTASEVSQRLERPVDTSSGIFTTTHILMADAVEVVKRPHASP